MPKLNLTEKERLERRKRTNKRTARESRERVKMREEHLKNALNQAERELLEFKIHWQSLIIEQCDLNILVLKINILLIEAKKTSIQPKYTYHQSSIFDLPKHDYSRTLADNFYKLQNSPRG